METEIINPHDIQLDTRMRGKRILVIGVVDERKDFVWKTISRLGVEVFAVGSRPREEMENMVKKYIMYDSSDHTKDVETAKVIVENVRTEIGDVDGCVCFWDTETPLADLVTHYLGKSGMPYSGVAAAMSKMLTIKALTVSEEGKKKSSARYASRCIAVECASDVQEYADNVGFPAIMKTEYGAGSMGVKLVNNLEEAVEHFNHIQELHELHKDRAYKLGGTFKKSCVLMQYLQGTEHCVDLAIFHGELVCAFVSDKGPQLPPDVFKTVVTMPSLLPLKRVESVVRAAFESCMALGLDHGIFDVDVMMTKNGPKLIEINPRMGGFCQREFILQCYNVDLTYVSCMIACDIKPKFASSDNEGFFDQEHDEHDEENDLHGHHANGEHANVGLANGDANASPLACPTLASPPTNNSMKQNGYQISKGTVIPNTNHLVGLYCYPLRHGTALKSKASPTILQTLHDKEELLFIQHEQQLREFDHEIPFCTVAVKAQSFKEARDSMVETCRRLGLETEDASMEMLLDYFTRGCWG